MTAPSNRFVGGGLGDGDVSRPLVSRTRGRHVAPAEPSGDRHVRRCHATLAIVTSSSSSCACPPAASQPWGPRRRTTRRGCSPACQCPRALRSRRSSAAPAVARHAASLSRTWPALDDRMFEQYACGGQSGRFPSRCLRAAGLHLQRPRRPDGRCDVPVGAGVRVTGSNRSAACHRSRRSPRRRWKPAQQPAVVDGRVPTRGYSITSYIGRDLSRTELRGVMPVLYLFLARTGTVCSRARPSASIRPARYSRSGRACRRSRAGVRIVFQVTTGGRRRRSTTSASISRPAPSRRCPGSSSS